VKRVEIPALQLDDLTAAKVAPSRKDDGGPVALRYGRNRLVASGMLTVGREWPKPPGTTGLAVRPDPKGFPGPSERHVAKTNRSHRAGRDLRRTGRRGYHLG
jgi:hypothetical protein